jgi:hypothetical protein
MKSQVWLIAVLIFTAGCQRIQPQLLEVVQDVQDFAFQPTSAKTATPFQPLQPTLTHTPGAVPRLAFDESAPPGLRAGVSLEGLVAMADQGEAANLVLGVDAAAESRQQSDWLYVLVAPFPTVVDGVGMDTVKGAWAGEPSGTFSGAPLMMSPETHAAFTALWGDPADGSVAVLQAGDLLDLAWDVMPSWALLPFEALEPRWKALRVDGMSPLDRDFDPAVYPLRVTFGLSGDAQALRILQERPEEASVILPPSNRDVSKMTTVVLTGVTALVRSIGDKMETKGMTYPGEDIREWLVEADLTHVSNESSFASDCPHADPFQADLRFCSRPEYIELLEYVEVDIVELSGNHILDWSTTAFIETLAMYRSRDWHYYAGGKDETEAQQPLLVEHNGNRLAFIGCNSVGPTHAWASGDKPGAANCGDYEWIKAEISDLAEDGYIVIVTLQHNEFNVLTSTPYQRRDFPALSAAGAAIVSGSQAHYPNPFDFYEGRFIHYGLGNLFFDQMDVFIAPGIQREFIDRHIFYDGRHISTEILTAHLEDFSRPRPMTEEERNAFLTEAFTASGW